MKTDCENWKFSFFPVLLMVIHYEGGEGFGIKFGAGLSANLHVNSVTKINSRAKQMRKRFMVTQYQMNLRDTYLWEFLICA